MEDCFHFGPKGIPFLASDLPSFLLPFVLVASLALFLSRRNDNHDAK